MADAGGRKGRPYGPECEREREEAAQREEGAAGTETVEAGTMSMPV